MSRIAGCDSGARVWTCVTQVGTAARVFRKRVQRLPMPSADCRMRVDGGRPERRRLVICPQCGAEYIPGFTRCSDCDIDLVEPAQRVSEAQVEPPPRQEDLVCVYRATVRGRLPIAESLLRSTDIPFVVLGGHIQQLAGVDGYGFAEVHVAAADTADARELLTDLDRQG